MDNWECQHPLDEAQVPLWQAQIPLGDSQWGTCLRLHDNLSDDWNANCTTYSLDADSYVFGNSEPLSRKKIIRSIRVICV